MGKHRCRIVGLAGALGLCVAGPGQAAAGDAEALTLAAPDRDWLAADDAWRDAEGLPYRFAVAIAAELDAGDVALQRGGWEPLAGGAERWRRSIRAEGATSLSLHFSRFGLPEGAALRLLDADGRLARGPFVGADEDAHGELWTPLVLGSEVLIELVVPAGQRDAVELELAAVHYGYRGFGVAPGAWAGDTVVPQSGACNLDVACLDPADPWAVVAPSVAMVTVGGVELCSGALLNNSAQDRRPLFATAFHCGIDAASAPSVVAYWNFQSPGCRAPGSPDSGGPGGGSLAQFNSGSVLRAAHEPSDFTLLELDDPVDPAVRAYWAGWDRRGGEVACAGDPGGASPTAGLCASIHHPATDEKRITFADRPLAITNYFGTEPDPDGTHLWVHWAERPPLFPDVPGVTEPGSSGSPLFDDAHRFLGQLTGGRSTCGATGDALSDYYGRLAVAWTGGETPETSAAPWLDPLGTGAEVLDGRPGCEPPAVPKSLVAAPDGDNRVELGWGAVDGADSYRIYRAEGGCGGVPEQVAEGVVAPAFVDETVSGGTTYGYWVSTVDDGEGCESALSSCVETVATGSCTLAPQYAGIGRAVSADAASCGIRLAWPQAKPRCGGMLVYNVYRGASADFVPAPENRLASCLERVRWLDAVEGDVEQFYVVRAEEGRVGDAGGGPCGGIEEGNTNTASAVATGPDRVLFEDTVEPGRRLFVPSREGEGANFRRRNTDYHSPELAWHVTDPGFASDRRLTLARPVVLPRHARLAFWQRMASEPRFDGGVLEISLDGGASWNDVEEEGVAAFRAGGYNATILGDGGSALGGRQAWTGRIGRRRAFEPVDIDLGGAAGESFLFRLRFASDATIGEMGWWVDDLRILAADACVGP